MSSSAAILSAILYKIFNTSFVWHLVTTTIKYLVLYPVLFLVISVFCMILLGAGRHYILQHAKARLLIIKQQDTTENEQDSEKTQHDSYGTDFSILHQTSNQITFNSFDPLASLSSPGIISPPMMTRHFRPSAFESSNPRSSPDTTQHGHSSSTEHQLRRLDSMRTNSQVNMGSVHTNAVASNQISRLFSPLFGDDAVKRSQNDATTNDSLSHGTITDGDLWASTPQGIGTHNEHSNFELSVDDFGLNLGIDGSWNSLYKCLVSQKYGPPAIGAGVLLGLRFLMKSHRVQLVIYQCWHEMYTSVGALTAHISDSLDGPSTSFWSFMYETVPVRAICTLIQYTWDIVSTVFLGSTSFERTPLIPEFATKHTSMDNISEIKPYTTASEDDVSVPTKHKIEMLGMRIEAILLLFVLVLFVGLRSGYVQYWFQRLYWRSPSVAPAGAVPKHSGQESVRPKKGKQTIKHRKSKSHDNPRKSYSRTQQRGDMSMDKKHLRNAKTTHRDSSAPSNTGPSITALTSHYKPKSDSASSRHRESRVKRSLYVPVSTAEAKTTEPDLSNEVIARSTNAQIDHIPSETSAGRRKNTNMRKEEETLSVRSDLHTYDHHELAPDVSLPALAMSDTEHTGEEQSDEEQKSPHSQPLDQQGLVQVAETTETNDASIPHEDISRNNTHTDNHTTSETSLTHSEDVSNIPERTKSLSLSRALFVDLADAKNQDVLPPLPSITNAIEAAPISSQTPLRLGSPANHIVSLQHSDTKMSSLLSESEAPKIETSVNAGLNDSYWDAILSTNKPNSVYMDRDQVKMLQYGATKETSHVAQADNEHSKTQIHHNRSQSHPPGAIDIDASDERTNHMHRRNVSVPVINEPSIASRDAVADAYTPIGNTIADEKREYCSDGVSPISKHRMLYASQKSAPDAPSMKSSGYSPSEATLPSDASSSIFRPQIRSRTLGISFAQALPAVKEHQYAPDSDNSQRQESADEKIPRTKSPNSSVSSHDVSSTRAKREAIRRERKERLSRQIAAAKAIAESSNV